MTSLTTALPASTGTFPHKEMTLRNKIYRRNAAMDGLQWRVAEVSLVLISWIVTQEYIRGY